VPRGFVLDNCDPDIKVDPSPVPNKYSCELYRKPEYNKHVFRQGMTSTVLDVTGDLSGVTEAT
ncbi:MAG: hypothetical protein SV760_04355, partial [Halobacteria archaeon]|nr:hypothetical protein [Halobacteria archaeon]